VKSLYAFSILLFAVVNLSAASTLYFAVYPGKPAQTMPSTNAVAGQYYTAPAEVPTATASNAPVSAGPGPNGPYLKVVEVSILSGAVNDQSQSAFSPNVVTLVRGVNNTVMWSNSDVAQSHTVASYSVPAGAASFSSGVLGVGKTYSYTFSVAGTYSYICAQCPWMTGIIVVK
jgi:plastocyanin